MGQFFTIGELCRSNVSALKGLKNEPNTAAKLNLTKLIDNVLDPLRTAYKKPIYVNSGYRCEELNELIGGAKNSDHLKGMAADIRAQDVRENKKLFDYIKNNLEFRQLIWEKGNDEYPSWVHVSYNEDDNKCQVLRTR